MVFMEFSWDQPCAVWVLSSHSQGIISIATHGGFVNSCFRRLVAKKSSGFASIDSVGMDGAGICAVW